MGQSPRRKQSSIHPPLLTQSYERELLALQAITDTALSHLDLPTLYSELLSRVQEFMGVANAALLLLEPDGQTLALQAVRGVEERAGKVRVPLGQGFAGTIAATRQPLLVDDLNSFPVSNLFLRDHLCSILGVPLTITDRLIGVLHVGTTTPRHFAEADIHLLQRVADRMALAIDHARLLAEAQQTKVKAEKQLGEIDALFNAVVDAIAVYAPDGTITHCNQAMRDMFADYGTARYESLPLAERALLSQPRDVQGVPLTREQWPQTRMLSGEHLVGSASGDIIIRGKNGRDMFVSVAGRPVYDAQGTIIGAVAVMRDVTERHQFEEERQRLDHLKDMFIHIASHELRAPLAPLILGARLLQQSVVRGADPAEITKRADDIVFHAKRMSRMLDTMLNMTRISEGKLAVDLAPADLADITRAVVTEAQQISKRSIALAGADAPVPAVCDAERLRQVLTNLVSNALKYAPEPATISVSLGVTPCGCAQISVRDTGPGIDAETQAHLFERFFRGAQHQQLEGLGLGLFIAQAIVQEHGGRLWVESTPGEGSTFIMELPLTRPTS